MSTFLPPSIQEVPTVDVTDPRNQTPWPGSPVAYRLFGHYSQGARARGQTLLLMSDGTVQNLVTFPNQTINVDNTQGNGDVFTEQGLGGFFYTTLQQGDHDPNGSPNPTATPPTINRVFLGGHVHKINANEVTLLTAAGYGANIFP